MPDPVTSIDARGRKQTHMLFQPDPYQPFGRVPVRLVLPDPRSAPDERGLGHRQLGSAAPASLGERKH
jgi:hypothetical protein